MYSEKEKQEDNDIQTSGNNSPVVKDVHTDGGDVTFNYGHIDHSFIEIGQSRDVILQTWESHTPDIAPFINALSEKKLIFLHGDFSNIKQLAKLCASHIFDTVKAKKLGEGFCVYEKLKLEDNAKLTTYIEHKYEHGGVFILPDLTPMNLTHCTEDISKLGHGKHYLIIITQTPISAWRSIVKDIDSLWFSPVELMLFNSEQRSEIFLSLIEKEKSRNKIFSAKVKLEESDWLSATKNIDSLSKMNELIDLVAEQCTDIKIDLAFVKSKQQEILDTDWRFRCKTWFYHLSERHQLLVLGLSIFNGVFSEQSFAILDKFVKTTWKNRSINLVCYDYKDIEDISRYYRIIDAGLISERIEPISAGVAQQIINICWGSHRRYIVTALPEVLQLLRDSISYDASLNTELYQNYTYRDQLRQSASVFLGIVGCHNLKLLEEELFLLLPEKNPGIQKIVSSALTYVYLNTNEQQFLKFLAAWNDDADKKTRLGQIIAVYNRDNTLAPAVYFQISTLLTISHISVYCEPNNLSENLVPLFFKVINHSGDESVRKTLEIRVLPTLLYHHFSQFQDNIIDFICHFHLTENLPVTLASVFSSQPEHIWRLLDSWFEESKQANDYKSKNFTDRLKVLCVAVKTLGYIDYNEATQYVTVIRAYEIIDDILKREHQANIRSAALVAIIDLAHNHLEVVDEQFQNLIASLTVHERDQVVLHLSNIYIKQRRQRNDGERILLVNGEHYHVWIYQNRPKMEIEVTMERWMEKVSNSFATQLAYLAESSFINKFEREENKQIHLYKEEQFKYQSRVETPVDDSVLLSRPGVELNMYSKRFAIPVGCYRQAKSVKKVIKAILPVAKAQHRQEQNDMIQRLKNDSRTALAKSLKRALYLEEHKNKILVALGGIALFMLSGVSYMTN